jgi:hypothetical protein
MNVHEVTKCYVLRVLLLLLFKCTHNFGEETSRKGPLRRPGQKWEDNIKVDMKEDGSMWTVFIRLVFGGDGLQ